VTQSTHDHLHGEFATETDLGGGGGGGERGNTSDEIDHQYLISRGINTYHIVAEESRKVSKRSCNSLDLIMVLLNDNVIVGSRCR